MTGRIAVCIGLWMISNSAAADTVDATLNDLHITFDARRGSILKLEYPDVGVLLETAPVYSGLVDFAYPIPEFEPLRLAARYSEDADIEITDQKVTITWPAMGSSRGHFEIDGHVWGQVTMEALPDGRSIAMRCAMKNDSDVPVRQVLFPDFMGLQPFAGDVWTEFRSGGFMTRPFQTFQPRKDGAWYAPATNDHAEYTGGSAFSTMVTRWVDFGGLTGGLSLFPRVWCDRPQTRIRLHRTEAHGTLRMAAVEDIHIERGGEWVSDEWILTPHRHGWAKGIGPYRDYVASKVDRKWPVPEHVKRGLGYRTIWMCKGYPSDPEHDVDFRFTDLPRVAKESLEHGLDELVIWFWQPPFNPVWDEAPVYEHLGTAEDLSRAIDACHKMGVNVSLFVSWVSISNPTAQRYGIPVPPGGWNYHPEMVPRANPPYSVERATGGVDPTHELWQADVLDSVRHMMDEYTASICWDQVIGNPVTGELYDVFDKIREMQREANPEATLSGESVVSIERDASYLDYTWIWFGYREFCGYQAAFDSPRLNLNIDRYIPHVYYAFMDNLYLNVMPSKPDGPNGSAMIEDYPELSEALRTVNLRRQQFLPYFVDGEPVGNGLCAEPTYGAHVACYLLPERALMIAMNVVGEQAYSMNVDLSAWLKSEAGTYKVRQYRMDGSQVGTARTIAPKATLDTGPLKQFELTLFELESSM